MVRLLEIMCKIIVVPVRGVRSTDTKSVTRLLYGLGESTWLDERGSVPSGTRCVLEASVCCGYALYVN